MLWRLTNCRIIIIIIIITSEAAWTSSGWQLTAVERDHLLHLVTQLIASRLAEVSLWAVTTLQTLRGEMQAIDVGH